MKCSCWEETFKERIGVVRKQEVAMLNKVGGVPELCASVELIILVKPGSETAFVVKQRQAAELILEVGLTRSTELSSAGLDGWLCRGFLGKQIAANPVQGMDLADSSPAHLRVLWMARLLPILCNHHGNV